jgi:hypothetical protein
LVVVLFEYEELFPLFDADDWFAFDDSCPCDVLLVANGLAPPI